MFVPSSIDFCPSSRKLLAKFAINTSFPAISSKLSGSWQSYNIFAVEPIFVVRSSYIESTYSSIFSIYASPVRVVHFSPVANVINAFKTKSRRYGFIKLQDRINSSAISLISSFVKLPNLIIFVPFFFSILVWLPSLSPYIVYISKLTIIE